MIDTARMALSDGEIKGVIKTKQIRVHPRMPKLNPAGLDLRIDRNLDIGTHKHALAATIERIELSEKFLGILHIRSSLAREGLIASLALVDPGFRGQLTVSLYNAGDRLIRLHKGERFIQLSLIRLGTPSTRTYVGKYQNSRGIVESRRRKIVRRRKMQNVIHRIPG